MREHLPDGGERVLYEFGTTGYYGPYVAPVGDEWGVHVVCTGPNNVNAAAITALVAREFRPDYIFFVGVAGSIKDVRAQGAEVALGDVITSSFVYPLAGKVRKGNLDIRPHSLRAIYALEQAVQAAESDQWLEGSHENHAWHRLVREPTGRPRPPRVFHKPIVATDLLFTSREGTLFRRLVAAYPDANAVDMEGYGFLTAMGVLHTKGIVIRGLSDNIERKESGQDAIWQPIAATHAAAYTFDILGRLRARSRSSNRDLKRARCPGSSCSNNELALGTDLVEWCLGQILAHQFDE